MSYGETPRDEYPEYGCGTCTILVEALREAEQMCRETENECVTVIPLRAGAVGEVIDREEQLKRRLEKLKLRRDCALDVLLKHQHLEH